MEKLECRQKVQEIKFPRIRTLSATSQIKRNSVVNMNLGTMEAGDTKDEIFANDPYYETLHKIIACFLTG